MSVSFCYPCVRSVQQGLPLRLGVPEDRHWAPL